jgi:predicted Zn-dependent peptidase
LISSFQKTILDNGVTVVSEDISSVRSIAVGVWVRTGSRFERPVENGIAHFLEHMMFKGTKKRSPLKIAESLESIGGALNAFTGKEITCFYANALDTHINKTVEVLADITCNSIFPDKEIPKERSVILEEIKSMKDTPEEYIFDLFHEKLFPENSLGRSILGTESIVKSFQRSSVVHFWEKFYSGRNIIIAAAGNLNHSRLIKLVEKYFTFPVRKMNKHPEKATIARKQVFEYEHPISQAHLCIGGEGIPYSSDQRFSLLVLNTYLGGGMSSRLFQRLREKNGLAYSVYSFTDFYSDVGLFGIYIGTDGAKLVLTKKLVIEELRRLKEKRLSENNLTRIKNQLKGNLVLSLESTSRRMQRLARSEIYFNKFISVSELINNIDAVTAEDIIEVANRVIIPQNFITVILKPTLQ